MTLTLIENDVAIAAPWGRLVPSLAPAFRAIWSEKTAAVLLSPEIYAAHYMPSALGAATSSMPLDHQEQGSIPTSSTTCTVAPDPARPARPVASYRAMCIASPPNFPRRGSAQIPFHEKKERARISFRVSVQTDALSTNAKRRNGRVFEAL